MKASPTVIQCFGWAGGGTVDPARASVCAQKEESVEPLTGHGHASGGREVEARLPFEPTNVRQGFVSGMREAVKGSRPGGARGREEDERAEQTEASASLCDTRH